jgi:lipopolysaccharide transport system permease protein
MSSPPEVEIVTRIRPATRWAVLDAAELWRYRELLWTLAARDIKVRYKQTVFGVAWAILPPLMTMVVFNVLFGLLMGTRGRPTVDGVPYALSTLCALVPWQLFATSLDQSGKSLVLNRALITKVYFPRIIAPLAPIISALFDFAIALAFLVALIFGYHAFTDYTFVLGLRLLAVPLLAAYAVLAALSFSLWFSALNAIYRDVQYALPFVIQILMFVTPVIYPAESVLRNLPGWVGAAYGLNPMAGVTEGFRWALLGSAVPDPSLMVVSVMVTAALFAGGVVYFGRMESEFVDLV